MLEDANGFANGGQKSRNLGMPVKVSVINGPEGLGHWLTQYFPSRFQSESLRLVKMPCLSNLPQSDHQPRSLRIKTL